MRIHDTIVRGATATTLAALSSVFVFACSGGGGDSSSSSGGAGPTTSVDSSKPVSSLTEAEQAKYCADFEAYSASQTGQLDTKKLSCGLTALALASFSATTDDEAKTQCKASYDTCIAEPEKPSEADAGASGEETSCADLARRFEGCSATVGEVNQCSADQIAALKALQAKDWCADAKAGNAGGAPVEQPASCAALEKKCPSFFDSADDNGGGD